MTRSTESNQVVECVRRGEIIAEFTERPNVVDIERGKHPVEATPLTSVAVALTNDARLPVPVRAVARLVPTSVRRMFFRVSTDVLVPAGGAAEASFTCSVGFPPVKCAFLAAMRAAHGDRRLAMPRLLFASLCGGDRLPVLRTFRQPAQAFRTMLATVAVAATEIHRRPLQLARESVELASAALAYPLLALPSPDIGAFPGAPTGGATPHLGCRDAKRRIADFADAIDLLTATGNTAKQVMNGAVTSVSLARLAHELLPAAVTSKGNHWHNSTIVLDGGKNRNY